MKNFGLKFDQFKINDFVLGGGFIGTKEIQADGQWDKFLPKDELQSKSSVDVMGCTTFGTLNCIEILVKKLYNI